MLKQGVCFFLYILENLASSSYTVKENSSSVTGRVCRQEQKKH